MAEIYEQKVLRVAIVMWVAIEPQTRTPEAWHEMSRSYRERYINAAKAALEEEAREIEEEEHEIID
jgi:hypothetical protein